jgi:omega-6 fatty acid desaturase (delta-12 desaturase)
MTTTSTLPSWKEALAPHTRARTDRAVFQVATSLPPYLLLSVLSYLTLGVSPVLTALLVFPIAGFLIRTFVVFHDCTHTSLFPSRRANHVAGAVLGFFVMAPYRQWQREHAIHHATSGDLDSRGIGDVETLTVAEYNSKSFGGRLAYRLFRNPAVMFGLGPIFAMVISPRVVPRGARARERNSVLLTDLALVVVVAVLCFVMGWRDFLLVWGPPALLAGAGGVWLFYVQHQFEDAYWKRGEDWDYTEAALRGSTFLDLPQPLRFFTASIGLHHVHHLQSHIPNYNLQRAHDAHPVFAEVPTMSIWDGLRAPRFKLFDERTNKLVTFAEARRSVSSAAVTAQGGVI